MRVMVGFLIKLIVSRIGSLFPLSRSVQIGLACQLC